MNLKMLREDWTDLYSGKVRYAVGMVTECPDWDPYPECGHGLHYAEQPGDLVLEWHRGVVVEVEPVGPAVRIENWPASPQSKAPALRVLREIRAVPDPVPELFDTGVEEARRTWIREWLRATGRRDV